MNLFPQLNLNARCRLAGALTPVTCEVTHYNYLTQSFLPALVCVLSSSSVWSSYWQHSAHLSFLDEVSTLLFLWRRQTQWLIFPKNALSLATKKACDDDAWQVCSTCYSPTEVLSFLKTLLWCRRGCRGRRNVSQDQHLQPLLKGTNPRDFIFWGERDVGKSTDAEMPGNNLCTPYLCW